MTPSWFRLLAHTLTAAFPSWAIQPGPNRDFGQPKQIGLNAMNLVDALYPIYVPMRKKKFRPLKYALSRAVFKGRIAL
jgi:hypothetical protein